MYQNYFGLKEQAFSIAVNPRYLYMSQQHKEALAHLLYGVKEGGFVMLTGEVGTGKTTIIRCLLGQLPATTEIAIILNPMSNIQELLCTICDEFGLKYDLNHLSIKVITDLLHAHLLYNHKHRKKTVLLIDEAQLLSAEVLEQVRLLTNLETSTQKLLQIVLVGQPELNDLLAQPRLRQLSQRITARFHLTPLTLEETQRYINHRLSVAGMPDSRNPFTPQIVKQIHRFTGGIPRMINVLCERTLIGAYGHNKPLVDNNILQMAKAEVEGNRQSGPNEPKHGSLPLYVGIGAGITLGLAVVALLGVLIFSPQNNPAPAENAQQAASDYRASAQTLVGEIERGAQQAQKQGRVDESAVGVTNYQISDKLKAQALLFGYLKFDINSEAYPCWQINTEGYECSSAKFDTWEEAASINRPMILSLISSNKFKSHAILIGLQGKHALLLDAQQNQVATALDELGPSWTGEAFYVWKKPKSYSEPLGLGDSSDVISEVAAQFALIDAQPRALAKKTFNSALQQRIKIFQGEHKLEADGILGERTLMKLNESLGLSTTLNRDFL